MSTIAVQPYAPDTPAQDLPERLQRFYEALSIQRHAGLDRLGELFTDDVVFIDPFRATEGLPALWDLFERWLDKYPTIGFTDFRCDGDATCFTLTYFMHMRMAVGPAFSTPIASLCRARGGRVAELRDYYDLMSGMLSPSPALGRIYRHTINRIFF